MANAITKDKSNKNIELNSASSKTKKAPAENPAGNKTQPFLDAAISLARSICRDAIWHNDACNWIGSSNEEYYGQPKGYARALPPNFYDGTAGIAFFLSHLYSVCKDDVIKETAEGALQQLIHAEVNTTPKNLMGKLGFHTGYPGEALVLYQAAEIFNNKACSAAADKIVKKIMQLPQEHWGLDMIDGAAGAIPALLQINACYYKDKQLQAFITGLGDYLLGQAQPMNAGLAWNTIAEATQPLTGFGHGAAGIATALLELYALDKNKKWLEAASAAFVYENACFNSVQQNWPDFRSMNKQQTAVPETAASQTCGIAWCHGAPGIALSRLRAYEITGQPEFLKDAAIAIDTTCKQLSEEALGNYSVCHGIFGNAEPLLMAAKILNRGDLVTVVEAAANKCIDDYINKQSPIPNGLHSFNETPDFMLGTSGMGYFLLRLYDEDKFPSVVVLKR